MPNSFLNKFKNYLIPAFSVIAVVFLVPSVILPQIQKIRANWEIVSKNQDRLDALEEKADALENLAKAQEELDKNLAIAESALPIEKDVARLVRGVQNLAAANGLEVSKVRIQPGKTATESATAANQTTASDQTTKTSANNAATTTSSKTELIFELDLRGNIGAFQGFLKNIEGTKRLLILSSFKSTTDSSSDYSYNVVINAPFGPLPRIAEDQLAKALATLSSNNQKLLDDLAGSVFKNVTTDPLPTGPTGITDPFK